MKRFHLNLNLTSVIVILTAGVLLPVMLSTAVGIVVLALADDAGTIVTGVLVISFAVAAAGGALSAGVLVGKKHRLARRQADFLANVSHELRTPLSAIRLYAQTLESGKLADNPDETARCVTTILCETEWLDAMIEEVITWRASSRNTLALDMRAGPVGPSVQAAVDRFRRMVPRDVITLSVSIESRLHVHHAARAINIVVLNLLTNAYKYTGKDKQLSLRMYDENATVVIKVTDNGIGLSPGQVKRVFQPFYRADQHLDGYASGVGLGLAIARDLVDRHKGSIGVQSEEGKGSSFVINLPAVHENE